MQHKEPVVLGWSGGKDSALALHALRSGVDYEVAGLLTTVTEGYDRVSLHGVRRELLQRQAAALGLPLHLVWIPPDCTNEQYENRLASAVGQCQQRGVRTFAFGDLFLEDIRRYREERLARVGTRALFPVWGRETRTTAREFLQLQFRAVVVSVDTAQLDAAFAGRNYDETFLADLPSSVDPCGENGEFHTFVWDGPGFRVPVACSRGETVLRERFAFADMIPATQSEGLVDAVQRQVAALEQESTARRKTCPACGSVFPCLPGGCWCDGLRLTAAIRVALQNKYENCLCPECLLPVSQ